MTEMQAVVFGLNNDLTCGVDTSNVREIIQYGDIDPSSDMPKFIDGSVNIRGSIVPVINLNKRFKSGESIHTKKTKIIIADINGISIGFVVNRVCELIKFSNEDVEEPSGILKKLGINYIKCVGKKNENLYVILDLSKVLSEKEIKQLEQNKNLHSLEACLV
jgi:purine-binding chemotaxis protein CheW